MAKNTYKERNYRVTFKCGHTMKVRIGGYSEEYREAKAKEYENEICYDCKHEARVEQAVAKENADAEKVAEMNIAVATLKGSEAQISWAEKIRNARLVECEENEIDNTEIVNLTSAAFFINNREMNITDFIEKIAKTKEEKALQEAEKEQKEEMTKEFIQLEGSEKQIKWANDLRIEMIEKLEKKKEMTKIAKVKDGCDAVIEYLKYTNTSAKDIIDARDSKNVMARFYKKIK